MNASATRPLADTAEVERALTLLIEPGAVFEVRALDAKLAGERFKRGVVSGYFDNTAAAVTALAKLTEAKGVYVTLNPMDTALLARCANRLDYAGKDATTGDKHVTRRRWLLLDVDPDRPSGISATDDEKAAAQKKARTLYKLLKDRGWPEPAAADSGNGAHLLYLVDLPAEDSGLLQKVLAGLADYFDGDAVKIDRTVHNAARIVRLYGTLAAKGDNTEDRPHRPAKLLNVPAPMAVVTEDQLRVLLADMTPATPTPEAKPAGAVIGKSNGSFDVDGFLARHNVPVLDTTTEPDGTRKRTLKACPFNADHTDGEAAVFQRVDGVLGFKCFHNGCADKHWQDFRHHFEPNGSTLSATPAKTDQPTADTRPPIQFYTPSELRDYRPPEGIVLVGDCHITRGSVFVIGGAPGVGKSRAGVYLAVAGATGADWFGLKVHARFKTLIIQNENGRFRLSKEFADLDCAELDGYVRVCEPPPYGLAFDKIEFCAAVRGAIADFQPDVIVLDPWNAVARDDKAKDFLDTFAAVRSVIPAGDAAPALGIVCHTRKPKSEEKYRGRDLLHVLAGSYVLGSVPRTVFVMLHASDDPTGNEVVWVCCKNNDGELGERTAWRRGNALFVHVKDFDWDAYDKPANERPTVTEDDVAAVFHNGSRKLSRKHAASELAERTGCKSSACYNALKKHADAGRLTEEGGLLTWTP